MVRDIAAKPDILTDHPRMGRIVPELEQATVRELFIYTYRIIYEIAGDDIIVLTIVHQRRNLQAKDIKPSPGKQE